MNTKENQPFEAVIKDIKPSVLLGAEGNFPVAIVEKIGETSEAWYPLEADHELVPGDHIKITPQTKYHESGGSLTTYHIDPL